MMEEKVISWVEIKLLILNFLFFWVRMGCPLLSCEVKQIERHSQACCVTELGLWQARQSELIFCLRTCPVWKSLRVVSKPAV